MPGSSSNKEYLGTAQDRISHESNWSPDAIDLLNKRYLHKDNISISNWLWRIAGMFAARYSRTEKKIWQNRYYELFQTRAFFPTSAALRNCLNNSGSLSGCLVLPIKPDLSHLFSKTIPHILTMLRDGIGIGLDLTPLYCRLSEDPENQRPSPGPVEIMSSLSNVANGIMTYNGLKRAAFMASLKVFHADIFEFMAMKRERRLENINISIAIDTTFRAALESNDLIALQEGGTYLTEENLKNMIGRAEARTVIPPDLFTNSSGFLFSRSYENRAVGSVIDSRLYVKAKVILEWAAKLAHECGDPGIINLESINNDNPTFFSSKFDPGEIGRGEISATTPCGEQPLLPYEACHLGSFNLNAFVKDGFFDFESFSKLIPIAVRMMDDIIDLGTNSLPEVDFAIKRNRKIGIGIMGLADVLAKLSLPYDSKKGIALAEKITRCLNQHAIRASELLAKERGAFPNWKGSKLALTGKTPRRHATVTTIAPTGHISLLAEASTGIEPYFSLQYSRMAAGKRICVCNELERRLAHLNFSLKEWIIATAKQQPGYIFCGSLRNLIDTPTSSAKLNKSLRKIKNIFRTAHDISPEGHLQMIATLSKHVENGISKTVNLPNSVSISDCYQIFREGIRLDLKGITIFRDGCLEQQALEKHGGCSQCGRLESLIKNECGGYRCAEERGGCGNNFCEV